MLAHRVLISMNVLWVRNCSAQSYRANGDTRAPWASGQLADAAVRQDESWPPS